MEQNKFSWERKRKFEYLNPKLETNSNAPNSNVQNNTFAIFSSMFYGLYV